MREKAIAVLLSCLEWLGYDLALQCRLLREANEQWLAMNQQSLNGNGWREQRTRLLREILAWLGPQAYEIQKLSHSDEWKRHQLFALAKKRFPGFPDGLVALSADYALYYTKGGVLNLYEEQPEIQEVPA